MHVSHRPLWRALALTFVSSALLFGLATATAPAVEVTPAGRTYLASQNRAVSFITVSETPRTISCARARISDTIPNEETNPNSGGSVLTQIPSTSGSYSASFGECSLEGRPLSGGAGGTMVTAWNDIEETMVVLALDRSAFRFNDNETCIITIGLNDVQSIVGTWENGLFESSLVFIEQSMVAEATGRCGLGEISRVTFEGEFDVYEPTRPEVVWVFAP